jgi:hypothetical protein
VFGVSPDIKIILFGVRQLKNRRVTPNGEQIKDKKKELSVLFDKPNITRHQRNSGRRVRPYNEKDLFKSYSTHYVGTYSYPF